MNEGLEKLKKLRDDIKRGLDALDANDKVVARLSADDKKGRQAMLDEFDKQLLRP